MKLKPKNNGKVPESTCSNQCPMGMIRNYEVKSISTICLCCFQESLLLSKDNFTNQNNSVSIQLQHIQCVKPLIQNVYIQIYVTHCTLKDRQAILMLLLSKSTCTKFNDTPCRPAKTKPIEDQVVDVYWIALKANICFFKYHCNQTLLISSAICF